MLLKVPQLFQLGNYCLALFHSFESNTTLAFLHGWSVLTGTNHVTQERTIPHAQRIEELIRSTVSLWTHPLLLPVLMLEEHIFRASSHKATLAHNTTVLESQLHVTKSGRLTDNTNSFGSKKLKELMRNEERRVVLTTLLNSATTDTINFIATFKWDHRCCKFLHQTCNRIGKFQQEALTNPSRELAELLNFLECKASSITEHAESLELRLNLQLNVV